MVSSILAQPKIPQELYQANISYIILHHRFILQIITHGLCIMLTQNFKKCPKNRYFSQMKPQNYQKIETEEHIKLMEKFINIMKYDDDVQNIWHNWEE